MTEKDHPAVLDISGLSKSYGPRKALDGVGFAIRAGEFVALLGPNGAGKTTLFQLMSGLFVADAGTLKIAGYDIRTDAVKALAHLGIVFQQPTLDLDVSVLNNMRFHGNLHGMGGKAMEARIHDELGRVDLQDRTNESARNLSGGQRRRVELARALLHRPPILLMDEPTVGLDPQSRRDLLSYVLELKGERDMAILWSTHLVDEAEKADRVIVLHQGHILKDGTPESVVKDAGAKDLYDAFVALTSGAAAA
ncbi:MAG: ABC transporter ATP-binding protein [Rhodospirillaceae bacterium]|nr:ABC transporter ATP-binding protein [Rhodospirillaceae bacterium]